MIVCILCGACITDIDRIYTIVMEVKHQEMPAYWWQCGTESNKLHKMPQMIDTDDIDV